MISNHNLTQGQLVSVSRLAKNSVAISPTIIKEFKTVRELSHENVNPILGACPEPGSIMIVSGENLPNLQLLFHCFCHQTETQIYTVIYLILVSCRIYGIQKMGTTQSESLLSQG